MTTKNAAPSLQAEEAVAAKRERYVRSVASDLWGCQSKDATSVVDSRALDAAVRLLNEHAEALSTIATLRAALGEAADRIEEMAPSICDDCQTTDYGCGLMVTRGDGYCCKRCTHALVAKLRSAALDEKEG